MISWAIITVMLCYWFMAWGIGWYRLFEKAEGKGFMAAIPVVNLKFFFKIAKKDLLFSHSCTGIVLMIIGFLVSLKTMISNTLLSNLMFIIGIAGMALFLIMYAVAINSVCKNGNIKKRYAIGAFFLPPVFFNVIAGQYIKQIDAKEDKSSSEVSQTICRECS